MNPKFLLLGLALCVCPSTPYAAHLAVPQTGLVLDLINHQAKAPFPIGECSEILLARPVNRFCSPIEATQLLPVYKAGEYIGNCWCGQIMGN
ncbi:MAG: hypothetical protein EOP04_02005 [Proteobacteria bacterium]|nr:MAG: hypothetical protein EOP04_02005 [Pseudomonadota bacterium]